MEKFDQQGELAKIRRDLSVHRRGDKPAAGSGFLHLLAVVVGRPSQPDVVAVEPLEARNDVARKVVYMWPMRGTSFT